MYKRILLKFSGEQLSGKHEYGVDPEMARFLAAEARKVIEAGCELVIVVGGGNLVRGADLAGNGIRRPTADQMGMLSGVINTLALADIFQSEGVETRSMSNVFATQIMESYSFRLAENHLQKGRIVMVAGGMGRPFFTHDVVAVNVGLELECDLVLKATKVDGVYDKDPAKFKDAVKLDTVTFDEALKNVDIKVMDKAAIGLALEQNMQVVVFNALEADNLVKICRGEPVGTHITN
jgi:uridylate kinase